MATVIKIVSGYVEMPVIRARGGRAATRASNIKSQSSNRLEYLVGGAGIGQGVENTDTLKRGSLMPVERIEMLLARIDGFTARMAKVTGEPAETRVKIKAQAELMARLATKRYEAKEEVLSIWRDLPSEMGNEALALKVMALFAGMKGMP
jgi:hypothetical protein